MKYLLRKIPEKESSLPKRRHIDCTLKDIKVGVPEFFIVYSQVYIVYHNLAWVLDIKLQNLIFVLLG